MAAAVAGTVVLGGCGAIDVGKTRHSERTYRVAEVSQALRVKAKGRVELVGTDAREVSVRERETWTNGRNKPEPRHTVENGTLRLTSSCAPVVVIGSGCGVTYRISVPRGLAVTVETDEGSVTASGLSGAVRLVTGSGSITAENLSAASLTARTDNGRVRVSGRAGALDLHTDSGGVTADALDTRDLKISTDNGGVRVSGRADRADLRTQSGSINADSLRAKRVTARTDNGGVRLTLPEPPDAVTANTDSGSIHLAVPADAAYALRVSTDTGGRHIDRALRRDGSSARKIQLSTDNGGIHVKAT
ncbi:DUF4097 family beta strand repeat-containing protein [Actinomadura flavalba]|uniref:DUF4097 family beta strand repeat-containing protein n=1 Tax=Actinomadura flavalba TaxID=1120938 RepID=UPI0003744F1B|nr:DUF4097 family beta strand repeat-containing protein [Actinomadura flavalba]